MKLPLVIALSLQLPIAIDGKITLSAQMPSDLRPIDAATEICFVRMDTLEELGCDDAGPFGPSAVGTVVLAAQNHLNLIVQPPEIRAIARNAEGASELSAEAYTFQMPSCTGGNGGA